MPQETTEWARITNFLFTNNINLSDFALIFLMSSAPFPERLLLLTSPGHTFARVPFRHFDMSLIQFDTITVGDVVILDNIQSSKFELDLKVRTICLEQIRENEQI